MAIITRSKTGSTLLRSDGSNKTSTAISPQILIYVGASPVGAIKSISVTEQRTVASITELGTDGVIDSVPTSKTAISGNCTRIRFDRMRMFEAFGRSYIHLQSQRYPFDIQIVDTWNGDGDNALVTVLKNVWFNNLSYTYSDDNWIISDQAGWVAETIFTTLKGGPAAAGGEISLPLAVNSPTSDIERNADVGALRGSMDTPGILKSFLPF